MRVLAVAMLAVVLAVSTSHAQPGSTSVDGAPPPPPVAKRDVERRANNALALSLGATVGSLALAGAGVWMIARGNGEGGIANAGGAMFVAGGVGFMFAPSLGHAYGAGDLRTKGLQVRTIGAGIVSVGLLLGVSYLLAGGNPTAWEVTTGVGGAVIVAGAVYDIATVRSETRRYAHGASAPSLTPTAILTPSHTVVPGLGISGRF